MKVVIIGCGYVGLFSRRMHTPILIDGRNIYQPEEAKAAGLLYIGVGR